MSRLDWRFELEGIARGMRKDLQEQVGQTVLWFVCDVADSQVDEIYDVGAIPSGRRFHEPIFLPVLSAIKLEANEVADDRGRYLVDTFRIIFAAEAATKAGLGDLILSPNDHVIDRLIYENKVFAIDQIRIRGMLTAGYTVGAADCTQLKPEELVNDPDFQWAQST